jgi:hypothetical protein
MNRVIKHIVRLIAVTALCLVAFQNHAGVPDENDTCTLFVNTYAGPNYCYAGRENQLFTTYNCTFDSFHIIVFNKLAEEVFQSNDIDFVRHTEHVIEGAYYYLMSYQDMQGEERIIKGVVNVMH